METVKLCGKSTMMFLIGCKAQEYRCENSRNASGGWGRGRAPCFPLSASPLPWLSSQPRRLWYVLLNAFLCAFWELVSQSLGCFLKCRFLSCILDLLHQTIWARVQGTGVSNTSQAILWCANIQESLVSLEIRVPFSAVTIFCSLLWRQKETQIIGVRVKNRFLCLIETGCSKVFYKKEVLVIYRYVTNSLKT